MVNFIEAIELAREGYTLQRSCGFYMCIEHNDIVFRNIEDNKICDYPAVSMIDIDSDGWEIYTEPEQSGEQAIEEKMIELSENTILSAEKDKLQVEFNEAVNKMGEEIVDLRNKLGMDTNYLAGYGPTIPIDQWLDMILQNGGDRF